MLARIERVAYITRAKISPQNKYRRKNVELKCSIANSKELVITAHKTPFFSYSAHKIDLKIYSSQIAGITAYASIMYIILPVEELVPVRDNSKLYSVKFGVELLLVTEKYILAKTITRAPLIISKVCSIEGKRKRSLPFNSLLRFLVYSTAGIKNTSNCIIEIVRYMLSLPEIV